MQYKLVCTTEPKELTDEVNIYLRKGWVLYGNPIIALAEYKNRYAQAMTKEDE